MRTGELLGGGGKKVLTPPLPRLEMGANGHGEESSAGGKDDKRRDRPERPAPPVTEIQHPRGGVCPASGGITPSLLEKGKGPSVWAKESQHGGGEKKELTTSKISTIH